MYRRMEETPREDLDSIPDVENRHCNVCGWYSIQALILQADLGMGEEKHLGYEILRECQNCGHLAQEWWYNVN